MLISNHFRDITGFLHVVIASAPAARQVFRRSHALPPSHRLPQEEFDLSVHASKLVLRPGPELIVEVRGQAEEKRFTSRHTDPLSSPFKKCFESEAR